MATRESEGETDTEWWLQELIEEAALIHLCVTTFHYSDQQVVESLRGSIGRMSSAVDNLRKPPTTT